MGQTIGFELHFYHYYLIDITTIVAIGTEGRPSTSLIMTTVVLNALVMPIKCITLVVHIDRIIDIYDSLVNITVDLLADK